MMKQRWLTTYLVAALFLAGCAAQALPVTLSVEFDEPTLNADLTPLTDLAKSNVYTSVNGAPPTVTEVLATVATGGVHRVVTVSLNLADGAKYTITVHATAVDTSGNESAQSNTATAEFDFIAPAAPTGVTVRKA